MGTVGKAVVVTSAIVTAPLQAEHGTSQHSYQADRRQERRVSWGTCRACFLGALLRTPEGKP